MLDLVNWVGVIVHNATWSVCSSVNHVPYPGIFGTSFAFLPRVQPTKRVRETGGTRNIGGRRQGPNQTVCRNFSKDSRAEGDGFTSINVHWL